MSEEKYLGTISVDSGTIMVADPCYWVNPWKDYCDELGCDSVHNFKHSKYIGGKGTAISVSDGLYPVSLLTTDEGKRRLIIYLDEE